MIRTSSSVAASCALVLALTAVAPWTRADASPADVATAKSLVVEGRSLRAKGNHVTARDRFKAAWALVPTPIIGFDLAREHAGLGELIEAREVAIEVTKLPENPKESAEGRAARAGATKLANDLASRIPSLTIQIDDLPSGAIVLLDGATIPVDTLGAPRKVNPGKHEIVVRAGEKEKARTVSLAEGAQKDVRIDASGLAPVRSKATEPTSSAPSADRTTPTWAWIGFGVGAVGLIAGGAFAITALGHNSTLSDECPPGRCTQARIDGLKEPRDDAWAWTVVAGAVGVAGIAIGVAGLSSGKSSATTTTGLRLGPGVATWTMTF